MPILCSISEKEYIDNSKKQWKPIEMMDYIWSGMIIIGCLYAGLTGNMSHVTEAILDSAREAISLCITMAGIVMLWTGIMEIAEKSGLVEKLTNKLQGVLSFLFPGIPPNHLAGKYIALNCVANILGLGWAATPAGLKAMEELGKLHEALEPDLYKKGVASDEMCTFLVLNISSLQLIPVNIIAFRSQYGSVNPAGIIVPGIIATSISTLTAVIFCKCMNKEKT